MNFFRRPEPDVIEAPKPKPIAEALEHVRRVPAREAPTAVFVEEYKTLLKKTGAPTEPLWDFELESFIRSQGWEILDPISVDLYMRGVCERLALRAKVPWDQVTWGWVNLSDYSLAIPRRVLERVSLLQDEFNKAHTSFMVTEVTFRRTSRSSDPFIRVSSIRGRQSFIFDVWDEPGFTG